MAHPKSAVVLISGRGSNLEALLKGSSDRDGAHSYRITKVLSDQDAPGLEHARKRGVPTEYFLRSSFADKQGQRNAIFSAIRELNPDLILLAGFMMIVPEEYTREFFGKMINIHPSLLPKYPGLHTHQRSIEAGEKTHGCSTHFVDHGVDTGPLIAQAECAIQSGDTPDLLAARLLPLEHMLYPWTVHMLAAGEIRLSGTTVEYTASALQSAKSRGIRTFESAAAN